MRALSAEASRHHNQKEGSEVEKAEAGEADKKVAGEEESRGRQEEREGIERVKECPECHSKNLVWDYERAELFCGDCGLVIAENLVDLGPE